MAIGSSRAIQNLLSVAFVLHGLTLTASHGYLKTPRSRNLLACELFCLDFISPEASGRTKYTTLFIEVQDKNWQTYYGGGSDTNPMPEDW